MTHAERDRGRSQGASVSVPAIRTTLQAPLPRREEQLYPPRDLEESWLPFVMDRWNLAVPSELAVMPACPTRVRANLL